MPQFRYVLGKLKTKKRSLSSTSTTLVAVTITGAPPTATNGRRKAKKIVRETAEFLYRRRIKSAVGGLKHIVDLLLKLEADKKDTLQLFERIDEISELLVKAIPDVTNMSESFQTAVIELDSELSRIAFETRRGTKKTFFKRLNHLRRHEGELSRLHRRLDDARVKFELNLQLDTAHGVRDIQRSVVHIQERVFSDSINASTIITAQANELNLRAFPSEIESQCFLLFYGWRWSLAVLAPDVEKEKPRNSSRIRSTLS
ncbi:hypothetical protein DFH11DRAFT_1547421 [Phellopilus nigrolimitatus]|nr:hypothetical protein DFH11DRAFT_1547421 [Phellopilus nigrolimitatus]